MTFLGKTNEESELVQEFLINDVRLFYGYITRASLEILSFNL
jgi:hypothetical protein